MNHAFRVPSRTTSFDLLRRVGWLSRTPAAFQQAVLDGARIMKIGRNEVLCSVGEPLDGRSAGLWAVVSGGIALEIAPAERGPTVAHFARPGFWFGTSSLITRRERLVTATATRQTTLLALTTQRFDQIVAHEPLAWRWIGQLAVEHLRLALTAVDDLMIRNPTERVIAILLRLTGHRGLPECEPTLEIDASQENVATMANLSRSSVGIILRSMEKRGLIEVRYRRIRVRDPERLGRCLAEEQSCPLPRGMPECNVDAPAFTGCAAQSCVARYAG